MSYQVLARKWRPRHFKDMVGQESILRMLGNALEQQRLHHAYLFTGTRGVGKTTIARILAKCLNCETGITANPCGTCHTCLAIDAGQFLDLYEVDAASRTKVEDTRELLDNVLYPPSQGRYKVYLIDEVHMLSNHSFNALLKTLEEPPEHVKFLLATTDPKKLPITILSRCLQFHLKQILPEQISKHLQHICTTENIAFELSALEKLSKAASGSMRDALSLLDQAIAYGHGSVNTKEVYAMLGSMSQDDILPLIEALASLDGEKVFALIRQLAERAPDFQQLLEEMISIFHQMAIAQVVPTAITDASLLNLAKQFKAEDLQVYYQVALLGRRDLSLTPTPQQGFEMTLLRMLAFKPQASSTSNVQAKPTAAIAAPIATPTATKPAAATVNTAPPAPAQTKAPVAAASIAQSAPALSGLAEWSEILPKLGLTGMAQILAGNCSLVKMENNKIELALASTHQPMLNQKLKDRINEALNQHFNKPVQLDINVTTTAIVTPVKQAQQVKETRMSDAKQTIMQDPKVKQLVEMYDATVEVSLI